MTMFSPKFSSNEPASSAGPSDKFPIVLASMFILVLFFMDALLWFERGGFFSVVSAILAAGARKSTIDIDRNGFWFPITALICIVAVAIRAKFGERFEFSKKEIILAFIIIGGGFLSDWLFGKSIIDRYMIMQTYHRCESRDHYVGTGKGRVWFIDYVLVPADCPAMPPDP